MSYLDPRGSCMLPPAPCECLRAARSLFERFHRFMPPQVTRSECRRAIPPVLMRVGDLRGLIYRSDRGQCGSPRTFIHFMRTPPVLACTPDGKQLYVVGGRYRVTHRGIEG